MSSWEMMPNYLKEIADKGNLNSARETIAASKEKLLQLGCTEHEIILIKSMAEKLFAEQQKLSTAQDMLRHQSAKWSRISFGCAALDRCTGGGIVTRGITEFCGGAGVGKTQLLLQLSIMVQIPPAMGGLGKGVAFICTEDLFPSKRMFELAKSFQQRYPNLSINYLGNIHVECVFESEDLLKCVSERLNTLLATRDIGLIVIDSVAAIYRLQDDYVTRANEMRKLANALLGYADKYHCAIICVNQVSSVNSKTPTKRCPKDTVMLGQKGSKDNIPCLGLAWAHLGRTRINISKLPKQINIHGKLITIRRLEILYSPDTPNEFAEFVITKHGVVDVL
ncbi:DNA repair protein XRCC3-like [Teleopsis dalmanni]|uniref:DNA repair protein XRCC3-like n=1 Tax=Teleopsis dalmanni TaxID=139649 RepID=UPI0018CDFEF1|nr:DNA repair protein XRCC3-like [Teleopsis dalmanni]XP_037949288.1 DNA repair protein XRCC3-like [Teleopsis dalmanni]XP_037956082.1 DNA repair protein XRCC3-like [Teleopsis dalmanni]XP_037956083.1 DNA repair protein XRCC3-like [Teleopsis dalmanni]